MPTSGPSRRIEAALWVPAGIVGYEVLSYLMDGAKGLAGFIVYMIAFGIQELMEKRDRSCAD